MKKTVLFFAAAIALASCNNESSADKATVTDTQTVTAAVGTPYQIDSTTTVTWKGSKPTGAHDGTFKVTEGSLLVSGSNLTGGNFTIDMNSLSNTDLVADADSKGKLEGHLKSADFFDVTKYPTAKFEITSVEPYVADTANTASKLAGATHLVKGNLTLKDSTKNISFPAIVKTDATTATASADFNIDRTLWGINYKGPNNPQDWVISKEVNIKLALTATKK